jgi:hypothetical protein
MIHLNVCDVRSDGITVPKLVDPISASVALGQKNLIIDFSGNVGKALSNAT